MVVGDLIGDGGLGICDDRLIAIQLVGGGGAHGGLVDGHGLVFVLDIRVGAKLLILVGKGLERDERGLVLDAGSIELEGHGRIAVRGLGGELGLGSHVLAVNGELLLRDLAVLIGHLLIEGAGDLIGLAGGQVLIVDGIGDGCIGVRNHVLVSIEPVGGGGADLGLGDGHGLAFVLDIRVSANLVPVAGNGLEGNKLGAILDGGSVEGEGDLHLTGRLLGGELGLSRHVLAVHGELLLGDLAVLALDLLIEGAGDLVGLAGGQVYVAHGIGDGGFRLGDHVLVSVRLVGGGGTDFRLEDGHLLGHIVLVLVLGELGAGRIGQGLIDHEGLSRKTIAVEAEIDGHGTVGLLSREGLGSGHGLAVHLEHIAGLGIAQLAGDGVALASDEVAVLHLVGDLDGADSDVVVAIGSVVGGGVDFRLRVIKRAEADGSAVAADGDGGVHQRVPLVRGAAKLLDAVGVERHGTERIVGLDGIACCGMTVRIEYGVVAEPEACGRIELRAVDSALCGQRPVVRVGVAVMGVPRGRGAEIAVLVGHGDMGLAGGEGGHLEGHASKAVGAVLGLLGELEVGTVDLLGNLSEVVRLERFGVRAFHNLLEADGVALEVARRCLGLAHDDGAARNTDIILLIVEEGIA